jgi:two-component system, OmpR family, sensor histidine kinase KdpD
MAQVLQPLRSMLVALSGIVGVTFTCYRLIHVNVTTAALALLLAILFTGTYAKFFETIAAAILATLCLDYFFIPPIGSITLADPRDWAALIAFLTVSVLATNLSAGLRNQRDELVSRQREMEKLYALSRSMLLSRGAEDVRRLMVNKCIELFGFTEVVLFESATGRIHRSQNESSIPDEKLRQVARHGSINHPETGQQTTIIPVSLGNKTFGSLAFREIVLPETALQGLGNTVALGLAQAQAQEAGARAEAIRKGEELKSMMIDALAHDLKTPLTVMQAAAGTLVQASPLSADQRRDLLEVIQQEAKGLERILAEAIHLARIDAKRLKLECRAVEVRELIEAAVVSLAEGASRQIKIELAPNLPFAFADRELILQALKQLIDNAAKYSPQESAITISASEANGRLSISVRDQGPGLTEIEQGRVFDKFYRGRYDRSAVQGTGMGLAIAKEIAEAHAGSIAVESQIGQGSRFTMILYAATRESAELAQELI